MTLAALFRERQTRNRIIFAALILLLPIVVYFQFFRKKPIPVGAERAVFCTKCKSMGAKIIVDIEDDKDQRNYCKICGGRLRYAAKCLKCKYEFPLPAADSAPPGDAKHTMDKFRFLRDRELCPNCRQEPPDTAIMTPDQIEKKADL